MRLGKFEKAFEVIEKAKRFDPENTELFIMAGDLHVIRNHHYRAVKEYKAAHNLNKVYGEIAGKLGLSYYKIQKLEKAKYYLLICNADIWYQDINVYEHLGLIYKEYNEPDSSIMFFVKVLDILKPNNNSIFETYINIAENYYAL